MLLNEILETLLGLFVAPAVIRRPHNDSAPWEVAHHLRPPRYVSMLR